MDKKLKIGLIVLSSIIVIFIAYLFKVDYYVTKAKYMADPYYCVIDSDCELGINTYYYADRGGRIHDAIFPRTSFTALYNPPAVDYCESNRCIEKLINATCGRNCLMSKIYNSTSDEVFMVCKKSCICTDGKDC